MTSSSAPATGLRSSAQVAQPGARRSGRSPPHWPPSTAATSRRPAARRSPRRLAEVLIGAGLRIGEAIALEWRDVDWDGSALNISRAAKDGVIGTPKGDRGRTVLIAPYLLELLRVHRLREMEQGTLERLLFTSP